MSTNRPIKILQVVGNLNRGGTETWLLNVLRHLDRDRFRLDFLVHTPNPGAYDDEVRRLGAGIVTCLNPSRPHCYAPNFLRQVQLHGPYDLVHSHVHHYSGFVLRLARRAGIGGRIAHSHSDTSRVQQQAAPSRRIYYALARRAIRRNATLGLAASRVAAAALFGPLWEARHLCEILHCGIDLAPFQTAVDRAAVRAELGVPGDAFVIGHVGRFVAVKNHEFLIDIAATLGSADPALHVVLIGDGPLKDAIAARAAASPIAGRVHFAGARPDVARLLAALDVFVFPSHYEGLPLSLVEAQAAGLPCVISDAISPEADAVPRLIRRLPVCRPGADWAAAVHAIHQATLGQDRAESWRDLTRTDFDIRASVRSLETHYGTAASGRAETQEAASHP
jgi:glycosyltransferase involved in cell wall biosynthesis